MVSFKEYSKDKNTDNYEEFTVNSLFEFVTEMQHSKKCALYIHGENKALSAEIVRRLQELIPEYTFYFLDFNLHIPDQTLSEIDTYMRKVHPNLVIGDNLGGFYALCITDGCPKIALNPLLDISEIKQSYNSEYPDEEIAEQFDNADFNRTVSIDSELRAAAFGAFSDQQEMFPHKKIFEKQYFWKGNMVSLESALTKESAVEAVEQGLEYFATMRITKESYLPIDEHYINLLKKRGDNFDDHKQQVYELLQNAYKPIGGLAGISSPDQLVHDADMWKINKKDGKILAAVCYKLKRGGRKLVSLGTDGSEEGKKALYKILGDDMQRDEREGWSEVDAKMEHMLKKSGGVLVPHDVAEKVLSDKVFTYKDPDGYHYKRMLDDGKEHEKVLVANPKYIFGV